MAPEQWASAKLFSVGQGRELGNFRSLFVPPIFDRAAITLSIGPHSGSFFPSPIWAVVDWMSTILHIWCASRANLECALNAAGLKYKTHVLTTGKKLVNLQPTNAWNRLVSLGHPIKFQQVSHLGFVTTPTSLNRGQQNFAQCLAVSWAGTLHVHFWGCCPLTWFCQVQNSLCIQVLCSPTLAALLHGTVAVGVNQTLRRGTRNGTFGPRSNHNCQASYMSALCLLRTACCFFHTYIQRLCGTPVTHFIVCLFLSYFTHCRCYCQHHTDIIISVLTTLSVFTVDAVCCAVSGDS